MDKIYVKLDDSEWHNNSSESVWAEYINGYYQIKNIPFYTKSFSFDDIVSTEATDGLLWIKEIKKRSGHSTYRIFLEDNADDALFIKYWLPIENAGCSYEKAYDKFYAIDVPPNTDIYTAYQLLEIGQRDNIWDFEEGFCAHLLNKTK